MNNDLKELDLELSLILARVYKSLKLKKCSSLDILEKNFSQNDLLFFPRLTLLAAQGPKGINNKIRTLAVLIQIIYLSTEIHNRIPENVLDKKKFEKEIQLPILVGDFLYSKFYDILCVEDCIEFLDDFIHFISELNLGWINYLENKLDMKEICNLWYGQLAYLAMDLASRSSGLNPHWNKLISEYGLAIGYMYGTRKLELSSPELDRAWKNVTSTLNNIPSSKIKEALSLNAFNIYELTHANTVSTKEIFSAVAEN